MIKVLVFGSFDVVHKGHEYFFKKARELGDKLIVVIGRDKTIKKVKGEKPRFSESERFEHVQAVKWVDDVVLGSLGDKYSVIEEIKPDIIALGYDQNNFSDSLEEELIKRGLGGVKIIRLDSFEPEKYKSSLIKKR
jgi:FAD synthetase